MLFRSYCDPHVETVSINGQTLSSVSLDEASRTNADLVVVLVGSPQWPMKALDDRGVRVFDAVNAGGSTTSNRERL